MYSDINHQHKSPFTYERTLNGVTIPYKDKGWLNSGVKICSHPKEEIENSLFRWRGTDVIYICHQCKVFWHVDMSD
jgi:hypothetical protein